MLAFLLTKKKLANWNFWLSIWMPAQISHTEYGETSEHEHNSSNYLVLHSCWSSCAIEAIRKDICHMRFFSLKDLVISNDFSTYGSTPKNTKKKKKRNVRISPSARWSPERKCPARRRCGLQRPFTANGWWFFNLAEFWCWEEVMSVHINAIGKGGSRKGLLIIFKYIIYIYIMCVYFVV